MQAVDGAPAVQNTLDLNLGLTQVLADGTNAYLYGVTRIGQQGPSGWAYHLPDALGSVRQMADPAADVALVRAYEPFGSQMLTTGPAASPYGFAGEWRDQSGLMYLRARYYEPGTGSFFQRDAWPGDQRYPLSMNGYAYALDNPVVYLDPSGKCAEPVSFILFAVVGGAIIGGITAATYDIAVTQGKGVQDLSNLGGELPKLFDPQRYCDVDWVEVALFGGAGSVAGSILGGAGGTSMVAAHEIISVTTAACADGDCSNEVKTTSEDLERAFNETHRLWNRVTNFQGIRVYQRNDLIDSKLVDALGRTNLQRMQSGLAPIGADGNPINLHHMLQTETGAIAEVTQTFHQMYSRILHINPPTVPSAIDRGLFAVWRSQYWITRASDFLGD